MGLRQVFRGLEPIAIETREFRTFRVDEVSKNIRETAFGSPDRALRGRSEDGDPGRTGAGSIAKQLIELIGKIVRRRLAAIPLQHAGQMGAGTGGASDAEINTARVEA